MSDKGVSKRISSRKTIAIFVPSDRDVQILLHVFTHRFLDTDLLLHSMNNKNAGANNPAGVGQQTLYRRLRILSHYGYLRRYYVYRDRLPNIKGGPRAIYSIGSEARAILSSELGLSKNDLAKLIRSDAVKVPFVNHSMEISRFRITLETACSASLGRVELLRWNQEQILKWNDGPIIGEKSAESKVLSPDAMFSLRIKGRIVNFFLECDRGTAPVHSLGQRSDVTGKLIRYFDLRRHMRRNRLPDCITTVCQSVNGPMRPRFSGFNVLFVVSTYSNEPSGAQQRITNIQNSMRKLGKSYSTSSLVWFCTSQAYQIAQPNSILARMWTTTATDLGLRSLLD